MQQDNRTVKSGFVIKNFMAHSKVWCSPNRLMLALVLLTIVALPLQYTFGLMEPVVTIRMYYLSFVGIALFMLLYFDIQQRQNLATGTLFKKYMYLQFVFIAWILCGVLYALNYQASLFESARLLLVLSFASICYYLHQTQHNFITYFFIALSISGLLQAGLSFSYYYGHNYFMVPALGNEAAGLFINRSVYAAYAAFCMLAAMGLCIKKHLALQVLGVVTTVISACVILLTQTRSAIFGLLLAGVVLTLFLFIKIKQKRKLIAIITFSFLMLSVGSVLLILITNKNLANQLKTKFNISEFTGNTKKEEKNSSSKERLKIWDKTIAMCKDNPMVGVGFGNWKVHIAKYGTNNMSWGRGINAPDRVHNVYLEMLAELGIVGLLLYLSTWAFIFYLGYSFFKKALPVAAVIETAILFSVIACYSGDAMFTFTHRNIDHIIVFYSCIALLFAKLDQPITKVYNTNIVVLAGVVIGIYALAASKGSIHFLSSIQKLNNRIAQKKSDEAISLIENYKRSHFASMTDEGRVYEVFSSVAYNQAGMHNKAINEGKKILAQNPTSFLAYMNIGNFYSDIQQYDSTKMYLKKCLILKPQNDKVKFALGKAYYNSNQCDSAAFYFNTIELPDFTDAQIYKDSCRLYKK